MQSSSGMCPQVLNLAMSCFQFSLYVCHFFGLLALWLFNRIACIIYDTFIFMCPLISSNCDVELCFHSCEICGVVYLILHFVVTEVS